MGDLLWAGGEYMNLLKIRGAQAISCSPVENANFPLSKVYDDSPWPFRFNSFSATGYIQLYNNLIVNGDFETALGSEWVDASWSGGTAVRAAAAAYAGTYGLRVNGGASGGTGWKHQVFIATPGQTLGLSGALRGGAGVTGYVYIYNLDTSKYLKYDGTWGSTSYFVKSTNDGLWSVLNDVSFTVESYSALLRPYARLLVICRCSNNGDADFDDIRISPAISGAMLYGQNFPKGATVSLVSSSDAAFTSPTTEATFTAQREAMYVNLGSPHLFPYWRISYSGLTNAGATYQDIPYIHEGWLGEWRTITKDMLDGWTIDRLPMTQIPGAEEQSFRNRLRDKHTIVVELPFLRDDTDAQLTELFDEMDTILGGGHWPMVLVPSSVNSKESAFCLYGRMSPDSFPLSRRRPTWDTKARFVGMDIPLWLP